MLQTERLVWDSELFNLSVGKIELINHQITEYNPEPGFDLIYIFSTTPLSLDQFEPNKPKKVDCKIVWSKKSKLPRASTLVEYFDPLHHNYAELLNLAYLSGGHSRFKTDNKFPTGSFEKLYKQWIDNSLSSATCDVIVSTENDRIRGFITLDKKNSETAVIGLISVNPNFQGLGIGSQLIHLAEQRANERGMSTVQVATQEQNLSAMALYKKNSFAILNRTYIYHLWV